MRNKFQMRQDLPKLVSKLGTESPIELSKEILSSYNENISPDTIRMFIKRNPEVFQPILAASQQASLEQPTVDNKLFENGAFMQTASIAKWNLDQEGRVNPDFQKQQVLAVKNMCMGVFYLKTKTPEGKQQLIKQTIPNWSFKHPDRLTLEQAKEFIAMVSRAKRTTKGFRLAVRAFFQSRDRRTISPLDISGEVGKIGKWADAVAPKEAIHLILEEMKLANYRFYVANKGSYYTATRCTAALEEFTSGNLVEIPNQEPYMTVIDKGFYRKGRQTWKKLLMPDLLAELKKCFAVFGNEPFKSIDPQALRDFNRPFFEKHLSGKALECAREQPMHFWRHQFAQHMLRATDWNYELVAKLGGWSGVDILRKCYGEPPEEAIREAGLKAIPTI